jgi:hypothetical protein
MLPTQKNHPTRALHEAIAEIQRRAFTMREDGSVSLSRSELDALGRSLATALAAANSFVATSLGECVEAVPYSTLRPVLNEGQLLWRCNHDPEHWARRSV